MTDVRINETIKNDLVADESAKKKLGLKEKSVQYKEALNDLERRNNEHIEQEKRAERNYKKGGTRDEKGNLTRYWDMVAQQTKNFTDPGGQQSFIEWSTAMMDIFQYFSHMSKAMYYDETLSNLASDAYDNTIKFAWKKTIGNTGVGKLIEGSLYSVKETPRMLGRLTLKALGKEGPLPDKINYNVTIGADGKLDTTLLADEKPMPDEMGMKMLFDTGLVAWLEKNHNCKFDPATQKVSDAQGNLLTADKIQELRKDDGNGLNTFFSVREELQIESTISSSPRP